MSLTKEEEALAELAFGRILRMAFRPAQAGDVEEYYRCRGIMLDLLEPVFSFQDTRPNYARDRLKGAAGG
jgi:hypothetical protein